MDWAIRAEDLSVAFGTGRRRPPVVALDRVSFAIPIGRIVGILGPNGSGKTTLLRVLAGIERPSAGRAEVLGSHPEDRALIARLGFQPEEPLPWPTLTGREHLRQCALLMGIDRGEARERSDRWLERMDLTGAADRRVGQYSTGMAKRLGLAAAMLADPEVLLLDEPTSGLDPEGSRLVMDLLREFSAGGATVLLASHHLQEVETICHSILALVGGAVRAEGTLDELLTTGEQAIAVRGLDDDNYPAARDALERLGLEVSGRRAERRHLFALFREWIDTPR